METFLPLKKIGMHRVDLFNRWSIKNEFIKKIIVNLFIMRNWCWTYRISMRLQFSDFQFTISQNTFSEQIITSILRNVGTKHKDIQFESQFHSVNNRMEFNCWLVALCYLHHVLAKFDSKNYMKHIKKVLLATREFDLLARKLYKK